MAFSLSAAQSTFSGRVTLAQPRRAAPARTTRPATVAGIFDGLFGGGAKEPPATKAAPSKASSSTSQLSYICALPAARRGFLLAYTASSGLDCGYIYKVGRREEEKNSHSPPWPAPAGRPLQGAKLAHLPLPRLRCRCGELPLSWQRVTAPRSYADTSRSLRRTASRRTSRRGPRIRHSRPRRRRSSRRVARLPGSRQNTAFRRAVPGRSD